METEKRDDVEQAIAKLRGAIDQLNREGKKRLDEAFETVNGHFQRLFTTLFGGGEARLEMIAGEDPLESGLEIIAKLPGKKPVTLSLLSGGEQTPGFPFSYLRGLPTPIRRPSALLDEVDAPLDDTSVDRFYLLMEKMSEETATRFLFITHHPMTMMRMNPLFGVTMAEKGVSPADFSRPRNRPLLPRGELRSDWAEPSEIPMELTIAFAAGCLLPLPQSLRGFAMPPRTPDIVAIA